MPPIRSIRMGDLIQTGLGETTEMRAGCAWTQGGSGGSHLAPFLGAFFIGINYRPHKLHRHEAQHGEGVIILYHSKIIPLPRGESPKKFLNHAI